MAILPVASGVVSPAAMDLGQASQAKSADTSFTKLVDGLLDAANTHQVQADQAVQQLALGQTDNLHDVMLAMSKADLSLRLTLEVRNRLTEAYQEIMRMQV